MLAEKHGTGAPVLSKTLSFSKVSELGIIRDLNQISPKREEFRDKGRTHNSLRSRKIP